MPSAWWIERRFAAQAVTREERIASLTIGVSVATRMLMIRITARSSISVKPAARAARRCRAKYRARCREGRVMGRGEARDGAAILPTRLAGAGHGRTAPARELRHRRAQGLLLVGLLPAEAVPAEVPVE